jgi:hypothetical protein
MSEDKDDAPNDSKKSEPQFPAQKKETKDKVHKFHISDDKFGRPISVGK